MNNQIIKTFSDSPIICTAAGVTPSNGDLICQLPASFSGSWDRFVVEQIKLIIYPTETKPFAAAYDATEFGGGMTTTLALNYSNVSLSTQHGVLMPLEYVIERPTRYEASAATRFPLDSGAAWDAGEYLIANVVDSGTTAVAYTLVVEWTVRLSAPRNQ